MSILRKNVLDIQHEHLAQDYIDGSPEERTRNTRHPTRCSSSHQNRELPNERGGTSPLALTGHGHRREGGKLATGDVEIVTGAYFGKPTPTATENRGMTLPRPGVPKWNLNVRC